MPSMTAVADMAEEFRAILFQAPCELLLMLLNRAWENDKAKIEYLRFYEYWPYDPSRRTKRIEIREECLAYYQKLLAFNLPRDVKDRVQEIIHELWSEPVGPYCSMLFVPSDLNMLTEERAGVRKRYWDRQTEERRRLAEEETLRVTAQYQRQNQLRVLAILQEFLARKRLEPLE